MVINIQNKTEKFRFALVGIANTLIDFGILLSLTTVLEINIVIANFISTTCAFSFSFFANRTYTFQSTGGNLKKQIPLFIVVTLIGLWVIQPLAISISQSLLSPVVHQSLLLVLVPKVIATMLSLIWNYILYSRVVFKKETEI